MRTVLAAVVTTLVVFTVPLGVVLSLQVADAADRDLQRIALTAAFAAGSGNGDPVELPSSTAELGLYSTNGRLLTGHGPARIDAAPGVRAGSDIQRTVTGGTRAVLVPVVQNEAVVALVRAARSDGTVTATTAWTWLLLLALALVTAGVSTLLARTAAARVARPLEVLAADAAAVGERQPLPARALNDGFGVTEVDVVRAALHEASERLGRLLERERRLASDASHQLRTPLAGLRARLELVDGVSTTRTGTMAEALADIDRMDASIGDLLALAHDSEAATAEEAVGRVLGDLADRWRPRAAGVGRILSVAANQDVAATPVPARAVSLILDVLVDNALRHGRGRIAIAATRIDRIVSLTVTDEGTRITSQGFHPSGPRRGGRGLDLACRTAATIGARLIEADASSTRFALLLQGARAGSEPADASR